MTGMTRAAADRIISVALDKARELALKPVAVIVLDAGGNPVGFLREDGASPGRYQIAHGKAYGAIMLGLGGRALRDRADAQAYFPLAANGAFGGALIPVPGAVLVRGAEGAVIGAVGISGDTSENDEACALAGIAAAGFDAEP